MASADEIHGLDPRSGETSWSAPLRADDFSYPTLAADGDTVVAGIHTTRSEGSCRTLLLGLDPRTGMERWREELPCGLRDVGIDGDVVYASLQFDYPANQS